MTLYKYETINAWLLTKKNAQPLCIVHDIFSHIQAMFNAKCNMYECKSLYLCMHMCA